MIFLYTGRPAFRPFVHRPESLFYGSPVPATGTVGEFSSILGAAGEQYIVTFPLLDFSEKPSFEQLVRKTRKEYPGLLTPVYQGEDDRFEVKSLDEERAAPEIPPAPQL